MTDRRENRNRRAVSPLSRLRNQTSGTVVWIDLEAPPRGVGIVSRLRE